MAEPALAALLSSSVGMRGFGILVRQMITDFTKLSVPQLLTLQQNLARILAVQAAAAAKQAEDGNTALEAESNGSFEASDTQFGDDDGVPVAPAAPLNDALVTTTVDEDELVAVLTPPETSRSQASDTEFGDDDNVPVAPAAPLNDALVTTTVDEELLAVLTPPETPRSQDRARLPKLPGLSPQAPSWAPAPHVELPYQVDLSAVCAAEEYPDTESETEREDFVFELQGVCVGVFF